ncbi:DUF6455 family protein [Tropicimonas aquimaris]|uniref:DUF6455 family protein n=1 Tax=Tropicimonas aquimaris TaxID=914152 RepID=A0ABW3IL56_9RHOB
MSMPGDTDLHFWLTRSVGRCIGLNFSAAMDEGRLSLDDYMGLVRACRGCDKVENCQTWLGCQRGAQGRSKPPAFCRNARNLEALRPH